LGIGYAVVVVTFLGFAFARPSIGWFMLFFGLAGVFIAWEDTIEGAAVRDYIESKPDQHYILKRRIYHCFIVSK